MADREDLEFSSGCIFFNFSKSIPPNPSSGIARMLWDFGLNFYQFS
jgi:hypothetical protein